MNILQINKYFWLKGGADKVFLDTVDMLRHHGHQVAPFSMKDSHNRRDPFERFFVDTVDYEVGGVSNQLASAGKLLFSFDARRKMRGLLREFQPELAHFHIFQHQISPSVFGPLLQRNIPLVLSLHELKPLCPNYKMLVAGKVCERCRGRRFYHCALNRCTQNSFSKSLLNVAEMYLHHLVFDYYHRVSAYIAVSQFYRSKMIEYGFPSERIFYLPNCIDTDKYLPCDADDGHVVFFGRLSEEKGVATLIEAMSQHPETLLVVAGDGPQRPALERRARDLSMTNVRFTGHLSAAQTGQLVSRSRLTVLPSIWYENCPMSVLESFAWGKPVLGSRIGGIPELIEEGVDGMMFEPGNAGELSDKIGCLLHNQGAARDMGMAGRRKVEEKYSASTYYGRLMAVYGQVLQRHRSDGR